MTKKQYRYNITAKLYDNARKSMGMGCMLVQTSGVSALPVSRQAVLRETVERFNTFTEDNDPYGEHDFGKITMDSVDYFWKIDDYGEDYKKNVATHRLVLTIMRADEY
jgi:hypothetical protein